MTLERLLDKKYNIRNNEAREIIELIDKYKTEKEKKKLNIKIPKYSLGEELFNSISHGVGALAAVAYLVLMVVKANGPLAETTVSLFGATMIMLYTLSCIYHALSPSLEGKKVLRVLDHCNVYLLVCGTYIPVALLGVGGALGWTLFGIVTGVTILGIVFTSIGIDKFQILEVICHLINGWSILFGLSKLKQSMGMNGVIFLLVGGVIYTLGSILYGVGSKKKYMHSVFHVLCLLGTACHFFGIFLYLL